MSPPKIFDVSLTISPGMMVWPGNPPVSFDTIKSIAGGDSSNLSLVHLGTHTATHVDAPRHFLPNGAGVDTIPLETLVGPAGLFQLPDVKCIDADVLRHLDIQSASRVLFGTRNSLMLRQGKLEFDYAYVSPEAARELVAAGIRLVGIDYLSIERHSSEGHPAHRTLLAAGIPIIEGLYLAEVPAGDYELICLPLKLLAADGSPARVLLREL